MQTECVETIERPAPLCDQFNEWLRTRADDQSHPPPTPTPTPEPTPSPMPPKPREID